MRIKTWAITLMGFALLIGASSCANALRDPLLVGFSQGGSDTPWRLANADSIREYFVEGNHLTVEIKDANNDPNQQKQDVLDFINQRLDYIVISPVDDDGWEPILEEAQKAGIPVIVTDRPLMVSNNLYLTYFGGNPILEGERAVEWLEETLTSRGVTDPVSVVHLQTTIGSPGQLGRSQGLDLAISQKSNWSLAWQGTAEGSSQQAYDVLSSLIDEQVSFNVLYCESDETTLGALQALKEAGIELDSVIIISFGGSTEAIQMVVDHQIDVIIEHSPLLGAQLGELILSHAHGTKLSSVSSPEVSVIDSTNALEKLPIGY